MQFTVEEVAQEINASYDDIISWEKEQSKPNLKQLETLAQLYGRDIDFFLRETPELPTKIEFRGKSGQSLKTLSRETKIVLSRFEELCRTATEFEELIGKKREVKLTNIRTDEMPELVAQKFRNEYQLEEKPINNLRELLEQSGFRIFELSIPNDELSGFSFLHLQYGPCILINARDSKGRKNFTLAHEVAHLIYKDITSLCYIPVSFYGITENVEYKANRFAIELLLPKQGLRDYCDKRNLSATPTESDLSKIAFRWNVSIQALGYRLENLGSIQKGLTDRIVETKPTHFRRSKVPAWEKQLGKQFVNTSIEAYKKNLISVSKLAHTLHISIRKAMGVIGE